MTITVIGAGVVGCAIAHELVSRGARVRLVDARGVARGATRASAGILAPQIEGHIPELRRLASCSLAMYDEFIRRLEADTRQSIEYRRGGTLQVALNSDQARALSLDAESLTENGVGCTLLDPADARNRVPGLSDRVTAALLVPSHGYVAAPQLTEALAMAAEARGVQFSVATVVGIEASGKPTCVVTDAARFESDAVIVASGSWMVPSAPEAPPLIKPIRGQLLYLRCTREMASSVVWGADCYLVPWRDGTVLVGATVEDVGFDEHTTVDGVRGLLNAAIELIPSLGAAHLQEVRVGFRPKVSDELPIIGRSGTMQEVFYAVGHYRNGVLLAPLTASLVADLVLEGRERPELALVRPGRMAGH